MSVRRRTGALVGDRAFAEQHQRRNAADVAARRQLQFALCVHLEEVGGRRAAAGTVTSSRGPAGHKRIRHQPRGAFGSRL